jgi:hypothetical protein
LLAPDKIAELIHLDPEVSDVLLPAFAARRLLLMQRAQGTLTLVGHKARPPSGLCLSTPNATASLSLAGSR